MTFRTPSLTGSTARPTPSRASTIVSPSVRFAGSRSSNSAARDVRSTLNTLRRGGPRYPVTTGATLLVRVTSVPAVADGASAVLGRSAAEGAASARRRFRGIATVKQLSGASTLSTAIMTAPAYPATLGIGRKRSSDPHPHWLTPDCRFQSPGACRSRGPPLTQTPRRAPGRPVRRCRKMIIAAVCSAARESAGVVSTRRSRAR
jgi:hypothetical protein